LLFVEVGMKKKGNNQISLISCPTGYLGRDENNFSTNLGIRGEEMVLKQDPVNVFTRKHEGDCVSIQTYFSNNKQKVLTASANGNLTLYNVEGIDDFNINDMNYTQPSLTPYSTTVPFPRTTLPPQRLCALTLSAHGFVACASENGALAVGGAAGGGWKTTMGMGKGRGSGGGSSGVGNGRTALAFWGDQVLSAAGSQIKLWDLNQDTKRPLVRHNGDKNVQATSLCVHPDQPSYFFVGNDDGSLDIRDIRMDKEPVASSSRHSDEILQVMFHPNNRSLIYTCSADGTLLQWNTENNSFSDVDFQLSFHHNNIRVESLVEQSLSINSFDLLNNSMACGGDNGALFYLQ